MADWIKAKNSAMIFGYWSKIREILTESLLVLPSQYFVIFFLSWNIFDYFVIFFLRWNIFDYLFCIQNIYDYFGLLSITFDYLSISILPSDYL